MSARRLLYKNICCVLIVIAPVISQAADQHLFVDTLSKLKNNKEIPAEFVQPILTALSYFPELKDVHIIFRIRKAYIPLATKPDFGSVFKSKNHRTYIITISNQTTDTLTRLLYQNLTFEEQVGIMGHELSHVVDFNSKNFPQTLANGISHISKRYLDQMEFNTDRICVLHGLGKYLEAYSMHVRQAMHVHNWRGVDFVHEKNETHERYMNPDTIEKYMSEVKAH